MKRGPNLGHFQWLRLLIGNLKESSTFDVIRYEAIVSRTNIIDIDGWWRARYRVLRAVILEARKRGSQDLCDRVIGMCDREIAGSGPTRREWSYAQADAEATPGRPWSVMGTDDMWWEDWRAAKAVGCATEDSSAAPLHAAEFAMSYEGIGLAAAAEVRKRLCSAVLDVLELEISAAEVDP